MATVTTRSPGLRGDDVREQDLPYADLRDFDPTVGSGNDDSSTLTDAIASTAKRIYLPPTTEAIRIKDVVLTGQKELFGAGKGNTIFKPAGNTTTAMLIVDQAWCELRGFTLDGDKANFTATGVASRAATYGGANHSLILDRMQIRNTSGSSLIVPDSANILSILFSYLESADAYLLDLTGCNNFSAYRTVFELAPAGAIRFRPKSGATNTHSATVFNCWFEATTGAVPAVSVEAQHVSILNNHWNRADAVDVAISVKTGAENTRIDGNNFINEPHTATIAVESGATNTVIGPQNRGVGFTNGSAGGTPTLSKITDAGTGTVVSSYVSGVLVTNGTTAHSGVLLDSSDASGTFGITKVGRSGANSVLSNTGAGHMDIKAASTKAVRIGDNNLASSWQAGQLVMGAYYLWVDGSGRLKIKSGVPASDADGTIVGTQS